jgi:hypothetical protein
MVPDIDLQLQVVLKALEQAVRPALDPADRLAAEQLGLAMATLGMIRTHVPLHRRLVRRLLEDAIRMAEAVGQPGELSEAVERARALLLDPEAETHEIEDFRGVLNGRISHLIAKRGEPGLAALAVPVVSGARKPIERMRAWVAGAGFEASASDLPPIEALLSP